MQTSVSTTSRAVRPAKARPAGPNNNPFGLPNLMAFSRDGLTFSEQLANYGDVAFCWVGPYPVFMVNHPDLVREVLVEHWEKFDKWRVQKQVIGQVLGNSTFNSDGEHWKQQRKLVQPAFHHKRIAAYAEIMAEETTRLIDSWQPGVEYNLAQGMYVLTMSIITRAVFGADIHGREQAINEALTICLQTEAEQMQAPVRLPAWVPTTAHRRFQHAIGFFNDLMREFITARRQSGQDTGDLLSMLTAATDESTGEHLSDQAICDEALTVFSAGHETSANGLSWLWVELAEHPAVEAKLVEEVTRVLGDRPPTLADLRQLPYVEMVIKEILRLHPPGWGFLREANQTVTLDGWTVPKGSLVFLSPHTMHRDPRFWEDPGVFNPERFAEGWEKRLPHHAYFPFGGGPHVCTGQAMAQMEMQVILAMVMQRYHFTLAPNQDFTPHLTILQRPGSGVRATVQKR